MTAWTADGPIALSVQDRIRRTAAASEVVVKLGDAAVSMIALVWIDNAGIARVKAVPLSRFERAAGWGIGMSPVFDVFLVDDSITTSPYIGGPGGDLRLIPDLSRVVPLAAQPGWAIAPADRYTQEGRHYPGCQRTFAQKMVDKAAAHGLSAQCSFEVEWAVGTDQDGKFVPACEGPAYGMTRVIELSDYAREVVEALEREGVVVEQFHPEYAAGQMEISIAPNDPVGAADDSVLVRQTIRGVSQQFGLQASFAPSVVAGYVGNGGHVHLSLWRDGNNLLSSGSGRYNMTEEGEKFAAGVLGALPALLAVGSPSVASYIRLVPSHWAGVYQVWGRENREAAMRLVTGSTGEQDIRANLEVKCFDLAANPYLVIGSLLAAGIAGTDALPDEVSGDPAALGEDELTQRGIVRLPQSLEAATDAFEANGVLREAMGDPLFEAILAVRRGETVLFTDISPDDVVARTRWRW